MGCVLEPGYDQLWSGVSPQQGLHAIADSAIHAKGLHGKDGAAGTVRRGTLQGCGW